jgi:hypothetical protein
MGIVIAALLPVFLPIVLGFGLLAQIITLQTILAAIAMPIAIALRQVGPDQTADAQLAR